MKILITYYSRTGNTEKAAKNIAEILGADLDRILDKKSRKGFLGIIGAGKDALFRKSTFIETDKDPAQYDIVIIGTPVWAGSAAPAVRTYLKNNKIVKAAFFCTSGGGGAAKTFSNMEKLSIRPIATLGLRDKRIDSSEIEIREFCDKVLKKE
jgi:flavodoxin